MSDSTENISATLDPNSASTARQSDQSGMPDKPVYALVLRLMAGGTFRIQPDGGRLVHAAFLDVIRQIDPALSEALHGVNDRKPYTTSPIWSDRSLLHEGDEAFVRFTILDPALAERFVRQFLLYGTKHQFTLAGVAFAITHVHITPEGHARAGILYWQRPPLTDPFMTARVDFLTPTAFSRKHGTQNNFDLSMQPRHLWNYARRQWENAGAASPGQAFDEWVEAHTTVLRMDTRRQWIDFQRFKVPGMVGFTVYQLVNCTPADPNAMWWRQFARFMPFSSLGYKTTMGLGQCTVTPTD